MLTLLFLWLTGVAAAQDLPDCSSPQTSANTLLALLQPQEFDPEAAAACLDLPADMAPHGARTAIQLKQVLDARGHFVPVPDLSDDPAWMPDEGNKVILVDALPVVYLEKVGDQWLWSRSTVRQTQQLYDDTFNGVGAWVQEKLPPSYSTPLFLGVSGWQLVLLGLLILAASLASLLANVLLRGRFLARMAKLGLPVDPKLFERTRAPMRLLCAGAVMLWGVPELQLGIQASRALLFVSHLLVGVASVWMALRWIELFSNVAKSRAELTESRMDEQSIPMLTRLAQIVAVVMGLVFVLSNMGVDVVSLVAGLGIGGLALALGAQDTIKHLFGSLTIFFDRPFQVGDFVEVGGVSGTIEEVGFRSTRIRTSATSVVTVPNSTVANATVDNLGVRTFRRVTTTLGVAYDTSPDQLVAFVEGVRAAILEHPASRKEGVQVHFKEFGASSLDIMVWFYLDVPGWNDELTAKHEIFVSFLRLAEAQGVEFAFPTTTVHLARD